MDTFLSKRAAIVDTVNKFVADWRFPAEWHLPAQERKFTAWCTDVLVDKPHPRFETKILSEKVRLIRRCLRYVSPWKKRWIKKINPLFGCSDWQQSTSISYYQGLSIFSFTPFYYKLGLIRTLVDRIYKINNTWEGFNEDIKKLLLILCKNLFPSHIVERVIRQYTVKTRV